MRAEDLFRHSPEGDAVKFFVAEFVRILTTRRLTRSLTTPATGMSPSGLKTGTLGTQFIGRTKTTGPAVWCEAVPLDLYSAALNWPRFVPRESAADDFASA